MNNKTTYYQKYKEKLLNRAKKIIRNIKKKVCESKQKISIENYLTKRKIKKRAWKKQISKTI